jgi:hypothetical protein
MLLQQNFKRVIKFNEIPKKKQDLFLSRLKGNEAVIEHLEYLEFEVALPSIGSSTTIIAQWRPTHLNSYIEPKK